MSAVADDLPPSTSPEESTSTSVFCWSQKVPIPSYLIAIVCGKMESRDIGPRTRVWAEASVVDNAAYEFEQTEQFIQYAEDITGQEYVWGRYDLVCLPPSFPYGGMENPCLTFVTPTLLAGDRSLSDVVAHEIAHSWTGNLVTNETWKDFFLNEGWTVWLQRKIMARIHGKEYFDFDSIIGWRHLQESIDHFGENHPFTAMVPEIEGVDPDDSFSSVPYEKGFNFLYYLSRIVGEENFEEFAKAYIQKFKFITVSTGQFWSFFCEYFDEKSISYADVDFEAWKSSTGMPPTHVEFDTTLSKVCHEAADQWLSKNDSDVDVTAWTSSQFVVMLESIIGSLEKSKTNMPHPTLKRMEEIYKLSSTKNSEIRFRWQTLCIRAGAEFIFPQVEFFLKEQGRMKFVRPLFSELLKSSEGTKLARRIFSESKTNYHPIAQKMLAKDLEAAS